MARTYKKKWGGRNYNTFIKENMEKAVRAVNAGTLSLGKAAKEFNIKKINFAWSCQEESHESSMNISLTTLIWTVVIIFARTVMPSVGIINIC